jgi:hypothetical protein
MRAGLGRIGLRENWKRTWPGENYLGSLNFLIVSVVLGIYAGIFFAMILLQKVDRLIFLFVGDNMFQEPTIISDA